MHTPLGDVAIPSPALAPTASDTRTTLPPTIHINPVRSPDNVSLPIVTSSMLSDPPLRRSPRLSTAHRDVRSGTPRDKTRFDINVFVRTGAEVSALSRSGTPENEFFEQDEPSSVLATKISHAQDNPSPPPSPSTLSASPMPEIVIGTSDSSTPHSPMNELAEGELEFSVTPTPSALRYRVLRTSPHDISPASSHHSTPINPLYDLMTFDSDSALPETRHSKDSSMETETLPLPSSDNLSVDELLSLSPTPTASFVGMSTPSDGVPLSVVSVPPPMVACRSKDTEYLSPSGQITHDALPSLNEEYPSSSCAPHQSPQIPLEHWPTSEGFYTKSLLKVDSPRIEALLSDVAVNDNAGGLILQDDSVTLTGSFNEKKKRKGKEVATYLEDDVLSGSDHGASEDYAVDEFGLDVKTNRRRGQNRRKHSTAEEKLLARPAQRKLGSLSPTSADLLTQLLPQPSSSTSLPHCAESGLVEDATKAELLTLPVSFSFPEIPNALLMTPKRASGAMRFSSPSRSGLLPSPSKSLMHLANTNDIDRTPARRIPMEQAIAQGQISPQKAARLMTNSGSLGQASRTPSLTILATDSPARRVNISETLTQQKQGKWQGLRFGSPVREEPIVLGSHTAVGGEQRNRSESADAQPTTKDAKFWKPTSLDTIKPAKLPFPLIPSGVSRSNPIPKEDQIGTAASFVESKNTLAPSSSPSKSSLKQPSSKIPRIGLKPYARPVIAKSPNQESKMKRNDGLNSAIGVGRVASPSKYRIIHVGSNNNRGSTSTAAEVSVTLAANLKRKRIPEKTSPPLNRHRHLRQVPIVMVPRYPLRATTAQVGNDTTTKRQEPRIIRRVIDGDPTSRPVPTNLRTLPVSGEVEHSKDDVVAGVDDPSTVPQSRLPSLSVFLGPEPSPDPLQLGSEENILKDTPSSPSDRSEHANVRRTTRARKPVLPAPETDVFRASQRPLSRRKAAVQASVPSEREVERFAGMTAVALKALTTSNTLKNQKYLAANLETEVIRKEGTRPESPTVKVKTVSQRQQEERSKERKERAQRRAQRIEDGSVWQSDTEGHSDTGSMMDTESDLDKADEDVEPKYKRGPGDEEDYTTPDKLERHFKRARLEDDIVPPEKRRVKWDKGLSTTIYLDELKPGTRSTFKENLVTKGCLAPAAKALLLDTLGNLPNAETPLSELIPENVVVKKFVYDNDVEPAQPVVEIKNMRSRSKKNKS